MIPRQLQLFDTEDETETLTPQPDEANFLFPVTETEATPPTTKERRNSLENFKRVLSASASAVQLS